MNRGHANGSIDNQKSTISNDSTIRDRESTFSLPGIQHAPDLSLLTLADVERAVRRLRNTVRPCDGVVGLHQLRFSSEAIREDFEVTGCLSPGHRLERDVVASLRKRRAIP